MLWLPCCHLDAVELEIDWDCMLLVKAANSKFISLAYVDSIVLDILYLLSSCDVRSFKRYYGFCNEVANSIACFGLSRENSKWVLFVPFSICDDFFNGFSR